eukprot:TRINITY_DN10820_c0_g1_i1.p1 TRINITY_DN10820_c0_g1~~TRINITY_DN10820_c0_g1_i1.p1  ORF type:complete len:250 (-),score=33.18 TRINITY_DN10820_c0_g1_i1:71-730(-)
MERRVSVEESKKPEKKLGRIKAAAEGECPVRCAILYKGPEEWAQWLSLEQQGHMKRIDAVCERPILQLLNENMTSESYKSTVHNGYLILRVYRAPYNLFMISYGPLDTDSKPLEDPAEVLSSKGLVILGELDALENVYKEDIEDYFTDGCQRNLEELIVGQKMQKPISQGPPHDLHIVSRRMLTPEELGIVSRTKYEPPEIEMQIVADSDSKKRRCTIL